MESSHSKGNNGPPHRFRAHRRDGRGGSRLSRDRTPPPPPPSSSSAPHGLSDTDTSPPSSELRPRVSVTPSDDRTLTRGHTVVQECSSASVCERADGCDVSSDKGSSLPKRAPGCEKFVSMQSLASVRERSDDTARVLEPHGDKATRSHGGKRGRADHHHSKANVSEQSKKSEVKDKPDADGMVVSTAARKGSGFDKKNRSDGDDHFPRGSACLQAEPSALGREGLREAKSALNVSSKSSDRGGDRAPSMEKKDVSVGRLPLKKAFKTMRALTEVGNSRDYTVEKPEHGSNLGGENTGAHEKRSSSKSSGGGAEGGKDLQVDGALVEYATNIHDFPIKFSRISKRARSHRDRRSHEKLATKGGDHKEVGVKLEETSKQEEAGEERNGTDSDSEARNQGEDDAGPSSKGTNATEELPTKKEEGNMEDSFATCLSSDEGKGSSERREAQLNSEGNLAAQGDSKEQNAPQCDQASTRTFNMREIIDCNRPVEMTVGVGPDERTSHEASAMESQENGHTVFSLEDGGKLDHGCDRREHKMAQDAVGEQGHKTAHSAAGAVVVMETCDTSQGELPLNCPDEGPVGKKNHAHQTPVDGGLDTSKQLTLSLFAEDAEAQGEGFEVKGLTMMDGSERGKHRQRALNVGEDKVGEHVSYGHAQKPSKVGSFQLSLALPGTSAAGEASNALNAKGLVAPEKGVQSPTRTQSRTQAETHTHNFSQSQSQTQNFSQSQTQTNSDGFTTSLSFSQSFLHNPSCSLNCASLENTELSCGGSRQISQGNENLSQRSWQTASANEHHGFLNSSQDRSKHRQGNPLYQWALQNGNTHGFPSVSGSGRLRENDHVSLKVQADSKMLDSSSQDLKGSSARQGINVKDRSGQEKEAAWHHSAARKTRSEPLGERDREKEPCRPASPARRYSSARNEDVRGDQDIRGGKIGLQEIASEPVAVMAQKMQELPDSFLEGLKGLAKDLLGSFEKRGEFLTLQSIVKNRADLTEHTLLHAHQTQLEILVAFKTGVQDFVREVGKPLTYKVLTEIFLQTRCRNIACQQSLPVDGCDCKICSQKGGFCHECMCVVCSKFDSDNNTCRWVGCQICMHWCHTDCGLRMSYVAPAQGAAGSSEMQYQCVACGHRSELFGFVKSVFDQFSGGWGVETLTKELDCVRKIFHGSADIRGRQLRTKVEDMLQKLEKHVQTAEIQRSIMQFFSEANADRGGACTTANIQSKPTITNVATDRMPTAAQEAAIQVAPRVGNKDVDKARLMLQSYERERFAEKMNESTELHVEKARKRAEIEDIHSRVRMKQAEANMLQRRADEAHQDARGLQQIIIVKHKMIEDDYVRKYGKLRLNEVEEKTRKRFLELQALERAEMDYQKMKLRMEAQIKDLAVKMKMTNWQYA